MANITLIYSEASVDVDEAAQTPMKKLQGSTKTIEDINEQICGISKLASYIGGCHSLGYKNIHTA